MIKINKDISIEPGEIRFEFIRASGPGGQNVNKVSSAAQLRFDVKNSPSLPDEVRERLVNLAGSKITKDGELVIEAKRFRTQHQNRRDALDRFIKLIRQAAHRPKKRIKTQPSQAAIRERLQHKKQRSELKKQRGKITPPEE